MAAQDVVILMLVVVNTLSAIFAMAGWCWAVTLLMLLLWEK